MPHAAVTDGAVGDAFGERTRRRLRRSLWLACLVALAASLGLGARFILEARQLERATQDRLQGITRDAAGRIDRILEPVGAAVEELAGRLSRGEVDPAAVEPALRDMVHGNEAFYGGTVAYRPFGHDARTRLYAPYVLRSPERGGAAATQLADAYDYTLPEAGPDSRTDWYVRPMREDGRNGWSTPYFDPALKTSMITYSAAFTTTGARPEKNGVVTIDVSMDTLKQIIRGLDLGPGGFGALTTADGTYLYHPDERLVRQRRNLTEIARERNDPDRLLLAAGAAAGATGVLGHRSTTTGESAWLVYAPVRSTGWSLQITFVRNDVPAKVDEMRRQLVWITIAVLAFLASLALLLLRAHEGRSARLWAGTAVVSVLLLGGIGTVWYLALNHHVAAQPSGLRSDEVPITAREDLLRYTAGFESQRRDRRQPPLALVPTGIHIESMELEGADKIAVVGQVWQKYPVEAAAGKPRAVVFRGAQDVTITPLDTQRDGAGRFVVQRSRFQFRLVTQFDFSRYPLEIERIAIGIGPVERPDAQALVPDLDGYNIGLASHRPGLAPDVRLAGWTIETASFVLRPRSENSRFGLESRVDLEDFPDLYYEIGLKRIFVDAFISNLTPLIVVAIVLFALLLLPESVEIKEILGFSVSLFFVVVYAHLSIRRVIASGQIFYLEYFFLVVYFALLAVPINAFRRALNVPYPLLEYRGGLVMKVLYWPVMLGVFFLITLLKFY